MERLAELRQKRAGEINTSKKEPVDPVLITQEAANVEHNAPLPGPSICIYATETLEVYSCGCQWWDAPDGGVWMPCEQAKANKRDYCEYTNRE